MKTRRIRRRELCPDEDQEFDEGAIKGNEREYILSSEDKLKTTIKKSSKGKISAFSIRYLCYINNDWMDVLRIDADSKERAHLHIFRPNGTNSKQVLSDASNNYDVAIHDAFKLLRNKYITHKNNFIRQL